MNLHSENNLCTHNSSNMVAYGIKQRIAQELGGAIDVKLRCGNIADVVSDNWIAIVADADQCAQAICTLASYHSEGKQLRLHLLASKNFSRLRMHAIEKQCARMNIAVSATFG